tara:strand:+ start:3022 stop:3732 length:711 start_codon:yes stop_codon:yes gene_type:complete
MAIKPQQSSEDFGDLEFRWDLDKQQAWNPLARLGYAPKQSKIMGMLTNGGNQALYVPSAMDAHAAQVEMIKDIGVQQEDALTTYPDDVRTTIDYAKPDIWNHEYTHRGFDKILKSANANPEAFVNNYGKDTFKLTQLLSENKNGEREYFTELLDDVSKTKGKGLQRANLGEVQAFQSLVLGRDVDTSAITPESLTKIFPYAKLLKVAQRMLGAEKGRGGEERPKERGIMSLFSGLY